MTKTLSVLCWIVLAASVQAQTNQQEINIESQGPFTVSPDGQQVREGSVRLMAPDLFLITASRVVYDDKQGIIEAGGDVKIDYHTTQGLVEITAQAVMYNLIEHRGVLRDVTAQFGDSFFFVGDELEILNKGERFIINNGVITACNQPTAQWSLKVKEATVQKEGYAVIKGARFRLKNIPVFYIPWAILPAMQDRRSGVLAPDTGSSERNGTFFNQPIYWAPRRDFDMTITPTWFDKAGVKLGIEARYMPSWNLAGNLNGSFFKDDVIKRLKSNGTVPMEDGKALSENRYRVKWDHDQSLFGGHFDIRVDAGSDFSVDRDYLRNTERTRVRDYYYQGRFNKDYGRNRLTLEVNRRERILANREEVIGVSPMPELRLYLPNRHIGKGFYFRNYVYASHYDLRDIGADGRFDGQLLRAGLDSELSRAQNLNRFIHMRWGVGYKGAFYHHSDLDALKDTEQGLEDNEVRGGAYGFLETVGPRLQKTYRIKDRRFVHYLDAILVMQLGSKNEDPFLESVFLDNLDIQIAEQVRGLRTAWKVNSRIFAGGQGLVRPVLEMEISQDLDLESNDQIDEPIDARFRLLNLRGFNANGLFEYNPEKGTLDTMSVYGSVNKGHWDGYAGYVRRRNTTIERESFIGITQLKLPDWRSKFKLSLDYDFDKGEFKSEEFGYAYQGQCLGMAFRYVKSPFDSRGTGNKDFFEFTITFTNLGELGTKF